MSGGLRVLWRLSLEALRDALRRKTVLAVALVCAVAVMGFESCTSAFTGTAIVDGRPIDLSAFGGYPGLVLLTGLSLGVVVLAGLLASDELARPLADGTALLWLARPVSRGQYAGSRLLGTLAVVAAVELVLLGSAAALLGARQGLPLAPALAVAGATAVGAVASASLAMACSLWLPRLATLLVGGLVLFLVVSANGFSLLGAELSPLLAAVDRLGPPFLTAPVLAAAPWAPRLPIHGDALATAARLLAWSAAGPALLLLAFHRRDL